MLALQLSYCITNGLPFLGHKVIPSPVLYISTESDFGQLQDRYKTLGLTPKKDSLFVIDRDGKPNISILDHEKEIADFADDKTTNKLVIIDMLKDMYLGISYDINDFQDVAQKLMPKLRELCEKYNITILFTHHLNKRNETLGSTAFDACIDGKITLFETRNDHNHLIMKVINRDFSGFDMNLKRNEIIKEQKSTIQDQKEEISKLSELVDILNNNIESLKEKLETEVNKWKNLFQKMCKAIDKVLKRDKPKEKLEDYEDIADAINHGYYGKNNKNKDDFEIER